MIAHAQTTGGGNHISVALGFVDKINTYILYPLITLLIALAILYFLYGVFVMVSNASSSEARDKGRKHMLFGIIGIVVMLSAFTILRIAARTAEIPETGQGGWKQYQRISQ